MIVKMFIKAYFKGIFGTTILKRVSTREVYFVLRNLFTKKKKYATIPTDQVKMDIPEGLMTKCPTCKTIINTKELKNNLYVCDSF